MPNQRFKNAPLDQNQHCQLNGVKKTYATMPPEIRNKILEAALVLQNGVKIRNKVEVKDKGDSDEGVPVVGILATCQQVYSEGHEMYYRRNTFFLPSGPANRSFGDEGYFVEDLQRHHLTMITSMGVGFSIHDLTLRTWDTSMTKAKESFNREVMLDSSQQAAKDFFLPLSWRLVNLRHTLFLLWKRKVDCIYMTPTVTEIVMRDSEEGVGRRMVFSRAEFRRISSPHLSWRKNEKDRVFGESFEGFLKASVERVVKIVEGEVGRVGLEAVEGWVRGECRGRIEGLEDKHARMLESVTEGYSGLE